MSISVVDIGWPRFSVHRKLLHNRGGYLFPISVLAYALANFTEVHRSKAISFLADVVPLRPSLHRQPSFHSLSQHDSQRPDLRSFPTLLPATTTSPHYGYSLQWQM